MIPGYKKHVAHFCIWDDPELQLVYDHAMNLWVLRGTSMLRLGDIIAYSKLDALMVERRLEELTTRKAFVKKVAESGEVSYGPPASYMVGFQD